MTCEWQQPGNIDCQNCPLKRLINKDRWGSVYIPENKLPVGIEVDTHPRNAWIGALKQKTVTCRRGIEMVVIESKI
ncbi:MAG: hypothetical protein US62_C0034G0005 [Candidatus Woesebacteria bacterium GW2011_GWA1_37_8]|uniref:Uncharacterized protein n=2 Tax=Candidatus Woeseibacteriota TaxID=1752722 RepID=A0A0G0L6A5_9BACT|nr:MAG: hypothetical protein US39_C0016G0037 [Microgenomates group bacterium GW2011_GWC1_37_12b]KKQ44067.1 MAG: hypothetical protein US62_C0034G0005 [Candidatus Woesebacteria bacterium GW2011_GWA1_37_8]KKQ86557.1 MAG: hypothetical protein UT10_C0022G0018 [Candidatus Woesebacteria bacterium GW2011_GWB1_38_8b]